MTRPARPLRLGLLSTARINDLVLAGVRASELVEVTAVASRSAERARAYAIRHGIPRAHAGYDALLRDPSVDAVYVPLPNAMHVEWTLRAIAAGKHVLVEKPLSRHPAEVQRVFDAAGAARVAVTEAFMWRHNPQTARIAELVAQGAIGRLRIVRAHFSFPLAEVHGADDTRWDPVLDGGALMDVGCYCLSAMRLVAGEPLQVAGVRSDAPSGVDAVFAAVLRFADGVVGHLDCGFVTPRRDELEIVGDRGALVVDDPWHVHEPGIVLRRDGADDERIVAPRADSYRLEVEDLARAAGGGRPPLLGRDDALGQARAIAALYESAATGTVVRLGNDGGRR